MEGFSATVYRRIKGWRNGYERLNAGGRKRKARAEELEPLRRRRFWRIKLTPRLKLKLRFSPKKLLLQFRDAYVNMMLKIAKSGMIGGGVGGDAGFKSRPIKEYDEKMIAEIYKSIVTQGKMVPRDAAWIGSEISCGR